VDSTGALEEQDGYSPSTTAAIITGLIVAADIARQTSDAGAAAWYEARADLFAASIERAMFTARAVRHPARRCPPLLTADLVCGEELEYAGLDRAFLAHCRLRWLRVVLRQQWLAPKSTRRRRALLTQKREPSRHFNALTFVDGHELAIPEFGYYTT
jgi:hypothetical protein